jgi:hypothetical protein
MMRSNSSQKINSHLLTAVNRKKSQNDLSRTLNSSRR